MRYVRFTTILTGGNCTHYEVEAGSIAHAHLQSRLTSYNENVDTVTIEKQASGFNPRIHS